VGQIRRRISVHLRQLANVNKPGNADAGCLLRAVHYNMFYVYVISGFVVINVTLVFCGRVVVTVTNGSNHWKRSFSDRTLI